MNIKEYAKQLEDLFFDICQAGFKIVVKSMEVREVTIAESEKWNGEIEKIIELV